MGDPEECGGAEPDFPSGDWTGYYVQFNHRSRQDLFLSFREGKVTGAGSDPAGMFKVRGGYDAESKQVWLTKSYPGSHEVFYKGARGPDGIRGQWEIRNFDRGVFHIWPVGQGEGETRSVEEEIKEPVGVGPGDPRLNPHP